MIRRETDVRSLLPCPLCGRKLILVPSDSSLTFHCKSGHELPLVDLLSRGAEALKGLEALLAEWQREHESLITLSEHARRDRLIGIAQLFQGHAERMEARIQLLRTTFARLEKDAPLGVPA